MEIISTIGNSISLFSRLKDISKNMGQFYNALPIWQSVNAELNWTHIRLENKDDRELIVMGICNE